MIFFFYGPNTYMARRQIRSMVAAYKSKSGSDFGLERVDGETIKLAELTGTLQAMPFLANSRLVIIDNLGANKNIAPAVPQLLGSVPESTVAVFFDPQVDQRTAYFKTLSKTATAKKFEQLDPAKLKAWVRAEVQSLGGSIEPGAINRLVDIVGDDQWRLEQEIQKLANYDNAITEETVRQLVPAGFNQTIFELVDAIVAGNTSNSLTIYRGLLGQGTNEIYILSMIIWQLRNLLLAKTAGLPPGELAKRAGISPFVAGKAMTKSHGFELDQLKQAFLAAVDTDFAIKTGQGEPDQLVERLIYRLSQV